MKIGMSRSGEYYDNWKCTNPKDDEMDGDDMFEECKKYELFYECQHLNDEDFDCGDCYEINDLLTNEMLSNEIF